MKENDLIFIQLQFFFCFRHIPHCGPLIVFCPLLKLLKQHSLWCFSVYTHRIVQVPNTWCLCGGKINIRKNSEKYNQGINVFHYKKIRWKTANLVNDLNDEKVLFFVNQIWYSFLLNCYTIL